MFIANATYTSKEYGQLKLAISTDEQYNSPQKDSNNTIRILYSLPIAEAVMKAAAGDSLPVDFTCNDVHYTLLKYTAGSDERLYNKYRKNHVVRKSRLEKSSSIYVCSERCRCDSCFSKWGFDTLESVCGIVKTRANPQKLVEIDIQHCKHCSAYFIDKESLADYEEKYGPLSIIKRRITGNEDFGSYRPSVSYKEDTILSRNGYSTRLYRTQRREILSNLIECGVKKAELKDILSRFITQRGIRCPAAAVCWKEDLEFVNAYGLEQERVVCFD